MKYIEVWQRGGSTDVLCSRLCRWRFDEKPRFRCQRVSCPLLPLGPAFLALPVLRIHHARRALHLCMGWDLGLDHWARREVFDFFLAEGAC
jgi:hypothetical protein